MRIVFVHPNYHSGGAVIEGKRLVAARPMAHLKIGVKNLAHLLGLVRSEWS